MQIRNPEKVAIVGVVVLTLGAGGYWLGTRSAKGVSNTSKTAVTPVRNVRVVDATPAERSVRDRRRKPDDQTVIPVRHEREREIRETSRGRKHRNDHGRTPTKKKRSDAS